MRKYKLLTSEEYFRQNPDKEVYNRGAYAFLGVMLILLGVSTTVISTVIGKTITTGVLIGWLVFKIIPCVVGTIYLWLAIKDYK